MLACVLIALASCHKSDYIQVIPEEASIVISANLANMAEEGDLQNSSLMQTVNKYMGLITAGEAKELLQDYMKNPAKLGIDFTRPVFIFKAGDFIGITLCVADDDNVEEFVKTLTSQGLCNNATESGKTHLTFLLDEIVLAYNSHALLLMANPNGGNPVQTGQIAMGLMEQEKDYSFAQTETYSQMEKRSDCDVVMFSNGMALSESTKETLSPFIPDGVRLQDIEIVSSIAFQKGKAVFSADINGKSNTAQKLLEESNKNFHKIEGRYIDSPMEGFAIWACAGVKGEWLLQQLKQDPQSLQLLIGMERAIDIDAILRTIDGDVAVTIPHDFSGTQALSAADFMLMANVQNTDFLKDVDYWQKSMKDYGISMTQTKENNYILKANDYTLNWGVDDDNIYFASAKMFAANGISKRSQLLTPLEDEIKKAQFFLYLDLETIFGNSHTGTPLFDNMLSQLKSMTVVSKNTNNIEMTMALKDSNLNFLKAILK